MFDFSIIGQKMPSIVKPDYRLSFKTKMMWTGIILVLFFVLGSINTWGVNSDAIAHFEFLEIVFGSKFGSLITLGIGPIVTASIILQLLVGSKIIKWNLQNPEDKAKFMGNQKVLAVLFCLFEAAAYTFSGAIPPAHTGMLFASAVMLQLALGGYIIMLMDEVCSKWGIGSGISLFIAAGVSKTIIVRIFAPPIAGSAGGIIASVIGAMGGGQPMQAFLNLLPLISTIAVFFIVVYSQAIRIEIPIAFNMPFGKFASRRWPLKFIYTSNIPVILTAAVIANLQVVGKLLAARGMTFLGEYDSSTGQPISGIMHMLTAHNSVSMLMVSVTAGVLALIFALAAASIFKKYVIRSTAIGAIAGIILGMIMASAIGLPSVTSEDGLGALVYMLVMVGGSILFSKFWVSTGGMDAHSVAEQFKQSSIAIPGFRQDPRIVERVLERYIPALTVMGGAFVGLLAGFADLTSALGTGTGILLTVMIVYQLYEQIAQQNLEEMHPALRKFMGE